MENKISTRRHGDTKKGGFSMRGAGAYIISLCVSVSLCLFVESFCRAAEHNDSLAVKFGWFEPNRSDNEPGLIDLDLNGSAAAGLEYYFPADGDAGFSTSLMYSEPDVSGQAWAGGAWRAVSNEVKVWQFSGSYIKYGRGVEGRIDSYEGVIYGAGVGFSTYNLSNDLLGGDSPLSYESFDDIDDNSADFSLLLGYKWRRGYSVDFRWIVDEGAFTLTGAWHVKGM